MSRFPLYSWRTYFAGHRLWDSELLSARCPLTPGFCWEIHCRWPCFLHTQGVISLSLFSRCFPLSLVYRRVITMCLTHFLGFISSGTCSSCWVCGSSAPALPLPLPGTFWCRSLRLRSLTCSVFSLVRLGNSQRLPPFRPPGPLHSAVGTAAEFFQLL